MSEPAVQSGNYVLLERVGMGGMAEVFRAASVGVEGFERPVAIKRILPNLAADEDFVKMFVDEAKIAVQLQHPNIVEIFDLARAGDDLFIAMEYVHGKDMRAILDRVQGPDGRGARIPVELAVHVTAKICDALHHAHFAHGPSGQPLGIIHRDVSPQNVIVSFDGEVKVTDFGLAKAAGRAVQTQAGVVKGKLAYMSPEQLRGQPIDQRSDVYGVGILLWEMLTGVRLFLGKNDQETLRRVYHAQVPAPRSVRPDLHPELEAIVMRALEREVGDRYTTAELMQEDLTAYMYGVGPSIGTPGVSAFMRRVFPQAEPIPEPSVHPPRAKPQPDTARPRQHEPAVTHAPPRRAQEAEPAALRPGSAPDRPELTPVRPPISLDDLEDLVEEEVIERPRRDRVTRATKPPDEGSELVRTVLHRAIAASKAQTRPPPRMEPEEETNRNYAMYPAALGHPPEAPRQTANQPHVFRRPGGAERSSSALSAPRIPSSESRNEEGLADEDAYPPSAGSPYGGAPSPLEQPTHPFGRAYSNQQAGHDPYAPHPHEHSVETDEFGDPPTMVGDDDDLAQGPPASWDGEHTPLRTPRRR